MRGEDETLREGFELAKETPPHAWGRPPLLHARLYRGRNTPTCVGKTGDDKQVVALRWKHPHLRGEDSPLEQVKAVNVGNTPTCVGKTKTGVGGPREGRKHPHMRGEDPERSLNFFLHTWY